MHLFKNMSGAFLVLTEVTWVPDGKDTTDESIVVTSHFVV